MQPLEERVESLMKMARTLTERIVWPQRPLPNNHQPGAGSDLSQLQSVSDDSEDPLKQMPR